MKPNQGQSEHVQFEITAMIHYAKLKVELMCNKPAERLPEYGGQELKLVPMVGRDLLLIRNGPCSNSLHRASMQQEEKWMCTQGIPLQVVQPSDGLLLQTHSFLFHTPVLSKLS